METPNTRPHPYRPHVQPSENMTTSQLDEGYSDGQPDNDMAFGAADTLSEKGDFHAIQQAAMGLNEEEKKQLALILISSLDNKTKLEVNRFIKNLTHFDPALYLPAELVLNAFSYLSPRDLLTASQVSRAWRVRSQDNKLWRACFAREGWVIDKGRLAEFERELEVEREAKNGKAVKERSKGKDAVIAPSLQRRESRKRTRVEAFSDGETSASGMDGVECEAESDEDPMEGIYTDMIGVESTTAEPSSTHSAAQDIVPGTPSTKAFEAYQRRHSYDTITYPNINAPRTPADFQLSPTLTTSYGKLNWQYLYKHRRRLEDNWDRARYKWFLLPHPDHPEEGHSECIYTVQHSTNTLVSGSRDKSIRIWDLDTCRLKRRPLEGHEMSVLCLQFDEREEQDIIVSGGSDAIIIIWKFSTGEIIKMLRQAHDESVLNLRFDDRYIVTCSKDKTIKVWNRHALERKEDNPDIPAYVINAGFMDPAQGLGGTGAMIEPFTLLATFRGHHAAVNAVMIRGNTIVSASGDRTTKAWDLSTGQVVKNYVGHTKGIACVQFDGRRIVSGSSDQSVRIYDAEKQVEVACLSPGHNHLVRTVQARFGDLEITSDEELKEQAEEADRNFHRALRQGMDPANVSRNARRNAGSSRPEDMLAIGAKLPPGGGGSRWARIVSGSYDESLIIWRRDRNGEWLNKQQLYLPTVLRQGRVTRRPAVPVPVAQLPGLQAPGAQPANAAGANQQGNAANALAAAQNGLAVAQHANAILAQQNNAPTNQAAAAAATAAIGLGQQLAQLTAHMHQVAPNAPHINAAAQTLAAAQSNAAAAAVNPAPAPQPFPGAAAGPNPHAAAQAQTTQRSDSMRVFKLQFDARRIICCSQNTKIAGWDFADGEKALEIVGNLSNETA